MKNKLEHILLSILLGLSVLLGLSFWLNTIFNFNMFCKGHWDEFAKLQASQTPISIGFYLSFIVAVLIFVFGIYFIYRQIIIQHIHRPKNAVVIVPQQKIANEPVKETKEEETTINQPVISASRPPRLNLPNNMAQIVTQKYTQPEQQKKLAPSENPYNPIISEVFSNNGYIVKPNPTISGFTPNLFAIGNNEIVWIGGVDCDADKMTNALEKLNSVFKETLEDIPIHINAFILDTMGKYSNKDNIHIFKSIDELKAFIGEHPADKIGEDDRESFDSYSEYIDTIIQYIKNI